MGMFLFGSAGSFEARKRRGDEYVEVDLKTEGPTTHHTHDKSNLTH